MENQLIRLEAKIDTLTQLVSAMREDIILISSRLGEHIKHEKNCDKHSEALYGNGKPGITTRLELLEQDQKNTKERRKVFALIMSGVASVIGALAGFLFQKYSN